MCEYPNFHLIQHPLIKHKLTFIRDKNTSKKEFKELVNEISMLMTFEATKDFPLTENEVETPMCVTKTEVIKGKKVVLVPILRAGIGMVDGVQKLIPCARIGYIGIKRNEETFEPSTYYAKLPGDSENRTVILIDPMLATGGSAISAARAIKERGVREIKFLCLIAAPEGVKAFCEAHPDIQVYAAALDERLNDKAYIVPGLGDAGDRLSGTKNK